MKSTKTTTTTNVVPSVSFATDCASRAASEPIFTFTCPDCKAVIPSRDLRVVNFFADREFYECPRCAIGSLRTAWKLTYRRA